MLHLLENALLFSLCSWVGGAKDAHELLLKFLHLRLLLLLLVVVSLIEEGRACRSSRVEVALSLVAGTDQIMLLLGELQGLS